MGLNKPIVLVHHILHVFVGGDSYQRIQVFIRKLISDAEVGRPGKFGQFCQEGREGDVAVDGDDTGVAAHVTELVVVRAGEDFAPEAAHEADTRWLSPDDVVVDVVMD